VRSSKDNLKERLTRYRQIMISVIGRNAQSPFSSGRFIAGGSLKARKGTVGDGQTDHHVF
jgi:hypothetical protein